MEHARGKRLLSLDAFRGFTIAAMILVNSPGTHRAVYPQLKHAPWNGWTFTDTIFPFFLFIMGVSMVFSFAAREENVAAGGAGGLKPGRYVCLSVTDTGEGMDKATLTRAMEPFFTTKGVGRGTGLGLSMVHGMTEQSGGRFILKSRKNEGTTAELWLPLAKAAKAVREAPRAPKEAGRPVGPLVVLAVDDDGLVLMKPR